MKLSLLPLTLPLRHPFTLGNGSSRTHTAILMVRLDYLNHTGFGEAAMPPYLGENHESATAFLNRIDLSKIHYPFDFEAIHQYLDSQSAGDPSAKAALDIALHDLQGKIENKPLWKLLHSDPSAMKPTACTIGIDTPEIVAKKVLEANDFKYIKVKLGSDDDRAIINSIRRVCHKPLYVDVNQGWTDREKALDMAHWLKSEGVLWLEQPFKKDNLADQEWLMDRSPLDIFADEACQRLSDIEVVKDYYTGINIKLMKCTGLYEAGLMVKRAKELELQTLIGCMTETSCATMAAASIAPEFDFVDIDGPWMLAEQPFEQPQLENGKLVLTNESGLGLVAVD